MPKFYEIEDNFFDCNTIDEMIAKIKNIIPSIKEGDFIFFKNITPPTIKQYSEENLFYIFGGDYVDKDGNCLLTPEEVWILIKKKIEDNFDLRKIDNIINTLKQEKEKLESKLKNYKQENTIENNKRKVDNNKNNIIDLNSLKEFATIINDIAKAFK